MSINQTLIKRANASPEKTAVVFRDKKISFKELSESVLHLAASLEKSGLKKGDKLAIYLPNWPEYIFTYLAAWANGATCVPLDFMLTEDELVSCITHSEAKFLVMKPKVNLSAGALKKRCPGLKHVITCQDKEGGSLFIDDLLKVSDTFSGGPEINDKDYSIIFYTSGTTGKPKGVLINYLQLSAPPKSMDFFVGGIKEDDVALCALPFSHLGGLIYIQNCIYHGLTFVLMERFIPSEFLKNIPAFKVGCFWIVPSMYYAVLQLKEFETFDLSSLRWMVTFGASNSPQALRRFHQYCPDAHLLNGWGMTETNAPTVVLPRGSENIESVGRPLPWAEVKIFDDAENELGPGQTGEVVVKSWVVTDGYYKDEKLTAETLKNGWFHTGDLGRFDQEGFLYIVGRKKEMIKVGGEIVFEPEVESVILKHPNIAEAAVIGILDKLRGEVPKAFIVFKENKTVSEEDLRFFLRQHLAHFKIPHYFEFMAVLPKNRAGKVNKEALRKP